MSNAPVFLPADPTTDRGDDFGDGWPYRWSDLFARRIALGFRREDAGPVLDYRMQRYWSQEDGEHDVDPRLVKMLIAMENFVAEMTTSMLDMAASGDDCAVVLTAATGQDEFMAAHPRAYHHRRGGVFPYPFILQHVSAGRAAAELTRRGRSVAVYRGDKHAELAVRRLAVGLSKNHTADLLGVDRHRYLTWESGQKPPPAGLVNELQAIDDFITTAAAGLDVDDVGGGISVVHMLDEQRQFERTYPRARTIRDGVAYPLRVYRVAAARRAQQLGDRARITATS
jgi:transcriptional regulator with XRE-family HTH domain